MNANLLNLKKTFELNLAKKPTLKPTVKLDVRLAVDKSGSMAEEYEAGWVQKAVELFATAAFHFDDDKSLLVGFFNRDYQQHDRVTEKNLEAYVRSTGVQAGGGTKFTAAMKVLKPQTGLFSFFARKTTDPDALYSAMITDGDAEDFNEYRDLVRSRPQVFFQVVAIGTQVTLSNFKEMETWPNFHLIHIPAPQAVTDSDFYDRILNDTFIAWANDNS